MANEITVTASISVNKAAIMSSAVSRSITSQLYSMAGLALVEGNILVTLAQLAIPMGSVTIPHWAYFRNLDTVNFIRLRVSTGGSAFCKLLAGDCFFGPIDDAMTAPFAIADTASCQMEYMIVQL